MATTRPNAERSPGPGSLPPPAEAGAAAEIDRNRARPVAHRMENPRAWSWRFRSITPILRSDAPAVWIVAATDNGPVWTHSGHPPGCFGGGGPAYCLIWYLE